MYSDEVYQFISDYIYTHSGMLYSQKDFYRLSSRITAIIKELKVNEPEDLVKVLKGNTVDPRVHKLVIDIATNNETYFFRDNKPFKILINEIIPRLKETGTNSFNIWSAGCSSGQESYSIVISLLEAGFSSSSFNVHATDISDQILARAKSGNYTNLDVQRGLPITMLTKYFDKKDDDSWTVKPQVRSKVSFGFLNLLKDVYPINKYDIVFCRNVLIYQDVKNREAILNKIGASMKAESFLLMGSGESLLGINVPFKLNMVESAMVFKRV